MKRTQVDGLKLLGKPVPVAFSDEEIDSMIAVESARKDRVEALLALREDTSVSITLSVIA